MSDLLEKIASARHAVDSKWSPERERQVAQRLVRSRQRRALTRRASLVGAAALFIAGLMYFGVRARQPGPVDVPGMLRFADGSTATPLSEGAGLLLLSDGPDSSLVRLTSGGARFDVVPRENRHFKVDATLVQVEVLGTQFTVQHQAATVLVSVERGHVRVTEGTVVTELFSGERAVFPRALEPSVPTPRPAEPLPVAPTTAPPRANTSEWKALARKGEFALAYEALTRKGTDTVRDGPADLLLASDVARLSGHPAQAVAPLRELVARYSRDPRAPLAAFTLGRVLLDEVGRPREAAEAFRQVRRLDEEGHLAEDALARETEAWSLAGELELARERALEYLQRYPAGVRAQSVRRHGGLD